MRALSLLLAIVASACSAWVPRVESPARIVREEERPRVRVTVHGKAHVLHFPRVVGDSLAGHTEEPGKRRGGRRIAFALDEIEEFQTERFDGMKTGSALTAGIGAFYLMLLLAAPET